MKHYRIRKYSLAYWVLAIKEDYKEVIINALKGFATVLVVYAFVVILLLLAGGK